MLLPFHSYKPFSLTKEAWLAVLKVSTLFHFNSLRKLAISTLSPLLDSPTEKICVGRVHYVSAWVLDGYLELAQSTKAITEAQCDAIGDRTAIKIYLIRLAEHKPNTGALLREDIEGDVENRFSNEISSIQDEESARTPEDDKPKGHVSEAQVEVQGDLEREMCLQLLEEEEKELGMATHQEKQDKNPETNLKLELDECRRMISELITLSPDALGEWFECKRKLWRLSDIPASKRSSPYQRRRLSLACQWVSVEQGLAHSLLVEASRLLSQEFSLLDQLKSIAEHEYGERGPSEVEVV